MDVFIIVILLLNELFAATGTSFIFPSGQPRIYNGYVWNKAERVHLSPRLQALPDHAKSATGQICGIRIYNADGSPSHLPVRIVDPTRGLADIPIYELSELNLQGEGTTVYSIEAYDCDIPPIVSERVPLSIHIVKKEGPFYAQSSYEFTVSQNSHAGSVVGPVQAIQQLRRDEDPMVSAICAYHVLPSEVPFTVDKYGVLRVKQKLQPRQNSRPYTFKVVAEDCHRPVPLTASVDVIVKQITNGCQQGWTGLPTYLEFSGRADRPEKIFKTDNIQLSMCSDGCPGQEEVQVRLELLSAIQGYILKTATSDACSHNPKHLVRQWTLCDIHTNTRKNLLPDPVSDLVSQLAGPTMGNPPILVVPAMSWKFDPQSHTVWEIDPKYLNNDDSLNAFDTDFTLTFWLRRLAGPFLPHEVNVENREEAILCSQDKQEINWRFFSVSLQSCRVIIRLLATWEYTNDGLGVGARKPTVWTLGPIPTEYCAPPEANIWQWHHYAVTFDRVAWSPTSEPVSLLIDGQDVGVSESITTTLLPAIPSFTPSERKANPKITLGACYDPISHLTGQHLNAELAGVTLLLGQTEAPNNLRCLAQCGESLLVPNVMKYLRPDINVRLESDAVTITGRNVSHVLDVLRATSYVRPQPGVSPDYAPHATQARLLNLSTVYRCPTSAEITIPHTEIQVNVLPQPRDNENPVEVTQSLNSRFGSFWADDAAYRLPGAEAVKNRKPLSDSLPELSQSKPPVLTIQGSDIIIAEPSIGEEGIPLFPDLQFQLPEEDMEENVNSDNYVAAAAVPLEDCLVWIASSEDPTNPSVGSSLHQLEDERIDWPVDLVVQLGLSGTNDKHGVKLHGRQPAGHYERLLRRLHYFPPKTARPFEETNEPRVPPSEVRYIATVELVCSTDSGSHMTTQFSVKIVLESPEYIEKDLSNDNPIQMPSPKAAVDIPTFARSNRESPLPRIKSRSIREVQQESALSTASEEKSAGPAVVSGIVVTVIAILLLFAVIIIVFARKRKSKRYIQSPLPNGHRRRFPAQPADFGGSSLKHDPTLRLTANPIGEMEYVGLGTVREDMYGSSRELTTTHYIFSPPPLEDHGEGDGLSLNVRLADLEEFDEEYADEASEEYCGEDDSGSHVDEQKERELIQYSTECSEAENYLNESELALACSSGPKTCQLDDRDWLSDEDVVDDQTSEVVSLNQCNNFTTNEINRTESLATDF